MRSATTSREASDLLLGGLRDDWRSPRAWAQFLTIASKRSLDQARQRPRALAETTTLHVVAGVLARDRGGRRWVGLSWLTCALHLGMLEDQRQLGVPNLITLLRANLPAIDASPRTAVIALASDFIDGRLARSQQAVTPFGAYADVFADAAYWTWFALTCEDDPRWRRAALAVWLAPIGVVTAVSVGRGRMIDPPRPWWFRPFAAVHVALALRAWVKSFDHEVQDG